MVSLRDEFVDVVDGTPVIRWDRIVVVFSASFFTAWLAGLLDIMRGIGRGIASTIDGFGSWVAMTIGSIFGIPTGAIETALASNTEFLSIFGPFAPVVAVIELVVMVYLLVGGTARAVDTVKGVIS